MITLEATLYLPWLSCYFQHSSQDQDTVSVNLASGRKTYSLWLEREMNADRFDEDLARVAGKFESVGKEKGASTIWGLQMQK